MALSVEIDHKKLEKLLSTTPEELDRVMPGVAKRIGYRYLGFHRARRMRGPPGVHARGTAPSERGVNAPPTPRTSGLRAHFKVDVSGTKFDKLQLTMGTRSRVALEHELGATQRARHGRFMAIPFSRWEGEKVSRAKIASARRKLEKTKHVMLARTLGLELRNAKGRVEKGRLFVVRGKGGRAYLAELKNKKEKGKGRFRFWFHLQKHAVLPPRLEFTKLWRDFIPTAIKIFNGGIGFALRAVRRRANG